MRRAYFVSDIHIMSPESPRARLFAAFLHTLSGKTNITHLFLLGDIFDLWVADHRYFEGNHDLHLRYYWADQLGVTVHDGPTYIQLGERTVRLEHGDQMDPDDKGYLFLRTGLIRRLILNLPGSLIARIGDRASAKSRRYTSSAKAIESVDAIAKIHAHARQAYARKPFDLIISGHVHVRDDSRIDSRTSAFRSVNLGSWLDAPCYFKLDGTDERFYELTEEVLPQLGPQTLERLSAVK